jgi:hypothetical protein
VAAAPVALDNPKHGFFAPKLPHTPQEANFYKCARDGTPLPASLTGGGPNPIGCKKAMGLTTEAQYLLNNIAADEIAHVRVRGQCGRGAQGQGGL